MNFFDEFRRLAERFRRIQADNPSDGQRQIIAAMAWGAKLVKRAAAAGIVELPPGLSWPTSPTRPSEDDSGLWAMVWFAVVEALQVSYRDELPSNAHALKWQDVAPGIRRGAVPVADWRLRSENYATAADWLARYVTTAGAAAGGDPHGGTVETLQPSDAGPERAAGPAGIVLTLGDPKPDPTRAVYSADCRCVAWYGTPYTFTPTQAACVKVLIEHYKHGVPEVGESTILTSEWVDTSQQRLASVFDNGKHPAWGTMIKPGSTKGTVRLAKPGE